MACDAVRGKPSRTKMLLLLPFFFCCSPLLEASAEDEDASLALTRSVTSESGTRSPRSTAAATWVGWKEGRKEREREREKKKG